MYRDTVISPEEAEELMWPSSDPPSHKETTQKIKQTLQRMNSFHVGPVRLPHPVKLPNGKDRTNFTTRASSADYSGSAGNGTTDRSFEDGGRRSLSLRHGRTLDDYTILEGAKHVVAASTTTASKVMTVPLYRPKRSESRLSSDSCHIAIDEMTATSATAGKTSFLNFDTLLLLGPFMINHKYVHPCGAQRSSINSSIFQSESEVLLKGENAK
jgi:hypothetical protein